MCTNNSFAVKKRSFPFSLSFSYAATFNCCFYHVINGARVQTKRLICDAFWRTRHTSTFAWHMIPKWKVQPTPSVWRRKPFVHHSCLWPVWQRWFVLAGQIWYHLLLFCTCNVYRKIIKYRNHVFLTTGVKIVWFGGENGTSSGHAPTFLVSMIVKILKIYASVAKGIFIPRCVQRLFTKCDADIQINIYLHLKILSMWCNVIKCVWCLHIPT